MPDSLFSRKISHRICSCPVLWRWLLFAAVSFDTFVHSAAIETLVAEICGEKQSKVGEQSAQILPVEAAADLEERHDKVVINRCDKAIAAEDLAADSIKDVFSILIDEVPVEGVAPGPSILIIVIPVVPLVHFTVVDVKSVVLGSN